MRRPAFAALLAAGLALVPGASAHAGPVEEGIARRVEALREVRPGQPEDVVRGYNAAMDEAWAYYEANRAQALPQLRRRLAAEVAAKAPSDLVLLDLGAFLAARGDPADRKLAAAALLRLDPANPVARENIAQLFTLAHAVALEGDARILDFARRAFLERPTAIFIPQHALTLDGALAAVFLFGLQGDRGEAALRRALEAPAARDKALEALIWVGGPGSNDAVLRAMQAHPTYETFARGLAFIASVGGPRGRDRLVQFDASRLDARTQKYFKEVFGDLKALDVRKLRAPFAGVEGDGRLTPGEARERLARMALAGGHDERTAPLAVLEAGLPADELVARLREVRRAALRRVSDEALLEVKLANAMINAVLYEEKEK